MRNGPLERLIARYNTWRYGTLKDFRRELARGRLLRRYGRGLCTVPVARIVGSVSKAGSMDGRFRYKSGRVDHRLGLLRAANQWGMVALPPIELYGLNDDYYVVDGHHRVAVALENGQVEIEAYVVAHQVDEPPPSVAPAGPPRPARRWLPRLPRLLPGRSQC